MKKFSLGRIDSIDIIRGYFLFVIIIDHLGRTFGIYDLFTGRGTQWVSAAEGFFFVSGLMIGLVRGRKLADQPFKVTLKKVWGRAGQLYLWSIGLTLLFTIIAWQLVGVAGVKSGAFINEPISKLIVVLLTMQYNYGWADFLMYYVWYLLFSPLAIWLLRKNLWYLLLAISFIVWLIGKNAQLSWQILFFSGTVVGYYLPEIFVWWRARDSRLRAITKSLVFLITIPTVLLSLFTNTLIDNPAHRIWFAKHGLHTDWWHNFNANYLAKTWFDKYNLAPGRLILFFIWFMALYWLIRRFEPQIKKTLGKFFIPLGQNSLYVYIVHAFFVYFSQLIWPKQTPLWLNFLVNTVVLAIIWLMVKYKVLFKLIPR